MYFSKAFIPTLKEAPSDAEVISHKLLVRAGMIRQLTSGLYIYLPQGLKALEKVTKIVREEMNNSGALELLMPMVQPADLWQKTGRWNVYGKELLRFKDRHDRDYCLGPTHEEVITDLVRKEIHSYKQLPVNLYQIQTKFRDEIRPRFGLMRGREFIMKDAYSFDKDEAGCNKSYQLMYDAYVRIFERMGLNFRIVEADSGSIGGSFSHEFMVLAETGEDEIAVCTSCRYAANLEKAEIITPIIIKDKSIPTTCPALEEVKTPNAHTVQALCDQMGIEANTLIKTMLFAADDKPVAVLVRGDRDVNEIKLKNFLNANEIVFASREQVMHWTKAAVGFAGPVNLKIEKIYADNELQGTTDWVVGGNKEDIHLKHVDLIRDTTITAYTDLRTICEDDLCPKCGADITICKGIEVGHVFKLGTKYSIAMDANFLDENGKENALIMGTYGIGISRVLAACIEQNNDEAGIIFPPALAPYDVILLNLDVKNEEVCAKAEEIYTYLKNNRFDVLFDDRKERPGIKFKDADLLGSPMQLILGSKGLAKNIIEAKNRKTGEKSELSLENFKQDFESWYQQVLNDWT